MSFGEGQKTVAKDVCLSKIFIALDCNDCAVLQKFSQLLHFSIINFVLNFFSQILKL